MEERKLSDSVGRKNVLVANILRIITQLLLLILSCEFLIEPVRHLKIRAAEVEDSAQSIVGVKLVVEPEEGFSSAAKVMKVIERGRIQVSLRCTRRDVGQESQLLSVSGKICCRLAG